MKSFPIIFFDGVCGLCNGFVDWVLRQDKKHRYRFATLQGQTAKSLKLEPQGPESQWSIIFHDSGRVYRKSTAALKIITGLNGGWRLFGVFLWVPEKCRDWVYEWVARNRYRWFGKREVCRLPTPQEKGQFLP